MKKRIKAVDALRGFSLIGILIVNMLYFQFDDITLEAIQPTAWWDQMAFYFTKIFVEGSFILIFDFLFSYGIMRRGFRLLYKCLNEFLQFCSHLL